MDERKITKDQLIEDLKVQRPHVVILGAGASRHACPKGDKNGHILPVMKDFIDVVDLWPILKSFDIETPIDNFESFYSSIHDKPEYTDLVSTLEEKIFDYFSELELPDHPTVYDHLVLSLRSKDLIATFNWDPFLVQALKRNMHIAPSPGVAFLHGNVAVGFCPRHQIKGDVGFPCQECGEQYVRTQLMFPIEKKDYSKDTFLEAEWAYLQREMRDAFTLTVFGYGAPRTDAEAVNLMKEAWRSNRSWELIETDIIDKRDEDELTPVWEEFFFSHHFTFKKEFYDSLIPQHPRRSCEALWGSIIDVMYVDPFPLPREADFGELYEWLVPFVRAEYEAEKVK